MKAHIPALGMFILSLLVAKDCMAQKAIYTSPGGLSIGFGGGASYQTSDIANSKGFGADFILGSPIYQRENAFLSVDWKFRFLGGQNRAYDHRINPDDTYSNIRYNFFSYDVEFGLTLNRLRERTRIIISGFAGLGLTHGRTAMDLYDASDNLYDFSSIDANRDSKLVYQDLVVLSDRKFETKVSNKLALLPTAGLYLGYQFSRSFALGVEFKTNINLTEYNSFTGIDIDNRAYSGSGWDRNNYVSLGFRWQLGRGGSYGARANTYSSGASVGVVTASPHPSVTITAPADASSHTHSPNQTIEAIVTNVSGPGNISFLHNGFPVHTFTYNESSKILVANVMLREGKNNFRIQASNPTATAEDIVVIVLDPTAAFLPAPEVEFTSPSGTEHTTFADWIEVTARVRNVNKKEDIELILNGGMLPFEYYPVSGIVKTRISRNQEVSNMMIQAYNESGSAQDQLSIYFTEPGALTAPAVRFINPPFPVEVERNLFPLSAETQNVLGPNDVTLKINGNIIPNFNFTAYGEVKATLLLPEGINFIEIAARNEAGIAMESTTVAYYAPVYQMPVYQPIYQGPVVQEPVYQEPVVQQPVYQVPAGQQPVYRDAVVREPLQDAPVVANQAPEIRIISPGSDPFRTYEKNEELRATVFNVISKENILLKINGISTRDFSFNLRTKEVIAGVGLREGENILTLQARNEAGQDAEDQVIIRENRPCPVPAISLLEPAQGQISTNLQNYVVKAHVRNVTGRNQLNLSVNGKEVSYSLDNQLLISSVALISGANTLSLNAVNECGEDRVTARINYSPDVVVEPCSPPQVQVSIQEVQRNDATHELSGIVTHVKNKAGISLTLDGKADNGFQFSPQTGELKAKFKLAPGSHTLLVAVKNECGEDSKAHSVYVEAEEEEACGVRINPGNSDWQFCLVTPSGTFNRGHLTNSGFSYSGPASSLFFKPIAGGGTATVNGRSYPLSPGQYYLFSGGLQVNVSTGNPGSMGQWSVCISASQAPVSGNGNNRPKSPCESEMEDPPKEKNDPPKEKNDPPRGNSDRKKGNEVQPQSNEVQPQSNEVQPESVKVRSSGNNTRSSGNNVRTRSNEPAKKRSSESQSTREIRRR